MILTGRNPERLQNAAMDFGPLNTTTFDAIEANADYTEKEQENERDQAAHR